MAQATRAGAALTKALRPELTALLADLRDRMESDPEVLARFRRQHAEAARAARSAASWMDWSTDQLTQAGVGWLLASVFVRFCEDNRMLGGHPGSRTAGVWITSNDRDRRQQALDAERAFYLANSDASYREWLETAFAALARVPATADLVGDLSAIGIFKPSSDAINRVIHFWRRTDDNDDLIWDFVDNEWSTRFLGDLYQDLSEYARDKYALLQTPEFVEEFILDQTMEPALKDRPLEGLKLIDPTCGSGHFLLGTFRRLMNLWDAKAPNLQPWARVELALSSVYGVDLNPFAVAIARFRLIVAALQRSGDKTLLDAPDFRLNLAVGDSLLHGATQLMLTAEDELPLDVDTEASGFAYSTEDLALLRSILVPGRYDVVVGNPPYIVARDKALNARYRQLYRYCKGTYALTVPFMERFFELAKPGPNAGWVGQITSNSFMKREFGAPLIENFLANRDLRLIVDTSGAFIPGHGTPTVIIVGRNEGRRRDTVRAVLGIRGEPGRPEVAAEGLVWRSIVEHLGPQDFEDEWISIVDMPRSTLAFHPWSLSGGGATDLMQAISRDRTVLSTIADSGFRAITGLDEVFVLPGHLIHRLAAAARTYATGEDVRDYAFASNLTVFPYGETFEDDGLSVTATRFLWSWRTLLGDRRRFGTPMRERKGSSWWEFREFYPKRFATDLVLIFVFVATQNHFALDRHGIVANRHAPVVQLGADATEDDHLRLLGILNSSTACFWLKQNSHDKGIRGEGGGFTASEWERFFEFTGTTLQDFPLPVGDVLDRSRRLDELAQRLSALTPAVVIERAGADRVALKNAEAEAGEVRAQMIAEQEELDWEVYRLYGLIDDDLTSPGTVPGISLGERAFEIALARKVAAGTESTEWFARHASTPITEIPDHFPPDYAKLVQRRMELIESDRFINLLERAEYKRRWQSEPWSVRLTRALRDHLLDRLEDRSLWFNEMDQPQPRSVAEIGGIVETDPQFAGFIDALDMWVGQKGASTTASLTKLLEPEGVPYLAALRYKDSGLRKRAEWESVWAQQRKEDNGTRPAGADPIPVPPKYTSADFVKQSYWSHRGKLDVPKERFIAYPEAGRATDPSPLLGWAGWNHAQQGLALGRIITDRSAESYDPAVLTPLVAGVAELLPWVKQWHSGPDPNLGVDLAEYLDGRLDAWTDDIGVPRADLAHWRPPKATRGRRPASSR